MQKIVPISDEITNAITISKHIIKNLPTYNLYIQPILKYKEVQIQGIPFFLLQYENRPLTQHTAPIPIDKEYLNETVNQLLDHNLYIPITNKETIKYDPINHIPILTDLSNGIILTKWQNKTEFRKKLEQQIAEL